MGARKIPCAVPSKALLHTPNLDASGDSQVPPCRSRVTGVHLIRRSCSTMASIDVRFRLPAYLNAAPLSVMHMASSLNKIVPDADSGFFWRIDIRLRSE